MRLLRTLALAALALLCTQAGAQASPEGLWKTIDDNTGKERALVRVQITGDTLKARIESRFKPNASAQDVCDKCSGDRKGQRIDGLEIIRGVTKTPDAPGQWGGGTIIDPENGKEYKVILTLSDDGRRLTVRGYMGIALLGRTQIWQRAD